VDYPRRFEPCRPYVAALLAGCLAQTWLLFPTQLAGASRPVLPASAERLEIVAPDGEHLVGVRLPASGSADDVPLLLGFSGNAWNADNLALYLHHLFPGCEIVAFHYRGYSPSGGRPSAAALLTDSLQSSIICSKGARDVKSSPSGSASAALWQPFWRASALLPG
jgi:hypothetical protein